MGRHSVSLFAVGLEHGKCVAVGMDVAVEISRSRNMIDDKTSNRIKDTIRAISPYNVETPNAKEAWKSMRHDKKVRKGQLVFVLLDNVGSAVCVNDVTERELQAALRKVRRRGKR